MNFVQSDLYLKRGIDYSVLNNPPFVWDEERRFLMRCELDALYFHLYQIARDDVDYILETFPIVKRKDEAAHGEYLTKRIILEMYDQMAALPQISVPAPKGDGELSRAGRGSVGHVARSRAGKSAGGTWHITLQRLGRYASTHFSQLQP